MQLQLLWNRSSQCIGARCIQRSAVAPQFHHTVHPPALSPWPKRGGSLQQTQAPIWHIALPLKQTQHICQAASSSGGTSSSSSGNSSSQQQQSGGSTLNWFDRLPPKMQLGIMGGLLFLGMFVIPFLQPSFLYGDSSKQAAGQQPGITDVKQAEPSHTEKYKLPRYIPGASELYDFLQDNTMPKKLPDGRTESPGVLRIYLSSMIILALFYACSAVVSLILNGVAGVLRAVGVMGPPKPKEE